MNGAADAELLDPASREKRFFQKTDAFIVAALTEGPVTVQNMASIFLTGIRVLKMGCQQLFRAGIAGLPKMF